MNFFILSSFIIAFVLIIFNDYSLKSVKGADAVINEIIAVFLAKQAFEMSGEIGRSQ